MRKICDEHLYQLDKGLITREKLAELVPFYRKGGHCYCCRGQDHQNCCQLPLQGPSITSTGRETYNDFLNNESYRMLNCQYQQAQTHSYGGLNYPTHYRWDVV